MQDRSFILAIGKVATKIIPRYGDKRMPTLPGQGQAIVLDAVLERARKRHEVVCTPSVYGLEWVGTKRQGRRRSPSTTELDSNAAGHVLEAALRRGNAILYPRAGAEMDAGRWRRKGVKCCWRLAGGHMRLCLSAASFEQAEVEPSAHEIGHWW
jgi:hypothetical protein